MMISEQEMEETAVPGYIGQLTLKQDKFYRDGSRAVLLEETTKIATVLIIYPKLIIIPEFFRPPAYSPFVNLFASSLATYIEYKVNTFRHLELIRASVNKNYAFLPDGFIRYFNAYAFNELTIVDVHNSTVHSLQNILIQKHPEPHIFNLAIPRVEHLAPIMKPMMHGDD